MREFLQNSNLKVLPQNQFEDAVIHFIEKGGKEAVDEFVEQTLAKSLNYLVKLEDTKLDKDMELAIEQCKDALEKRWAKSNGKWVPKKRLKPRPEDYDSDMEGRWDDPSKLERWEDIGQPEGTKRSSGQKDVDMDDDNLFVSDASMEDAFGAAVTEQPTKPAPKRGAAAKTGRGGAAKKAAAPKKVAATRARPKKREVFLADSDEEEEEEQANVISEDDFVDEDEEEPPAPPPKSRASRTTKAPAATRATASRATRAAPSKAKQTTLNFSQSQPQRPSSSRVNQTQKTLTISDDEIDDDDDDAFEPVESTRSRRR